MIFVPSQVVIPGIKGLSRLQPAGSANFFSFSPNVYKNQRLFWFNIATTLKKVQKALESADSPVEAASLTVKPTSELMPTEPNDEAQEWQRKYDEAKKAREQGVDSSNGNQG